MSNQNRGSAFQLTTHIQTHTNRNIFLDKHTHRHRYTQLNVEIQTHTETDTDTAKLPFIIIVSKSSAFSMMGRPFARLSIDIMCGFVMVENCALIVRLKIKLILLGVAAQSLQEIEEYVRQQPEELSSENVQQWSRTATNFGYLVELIEPKVLQLQIFDAFEWPLKSKIFKKAYRLTAEELRLLENYTVATYNAEIQLSKNGVRWGEVEANLSFKARAAMIQEPV